MWFFKLIARCLNDELPKKRLIPLNQSLFEELNAKNNPSRFPMVKWVRAKNQNKKW